MKILGAEMRTIGKLLKLINVLMVFMQRRINLLFLYRSYQLRLIDYFHYSIKRDWLKSRQLVGTWEYFYQTHPKIDVNGVRPTISRFNTYRLLDYLTKDSKILDIGSNTGFFSLYISSYVKVIDAVEMDNTFFSIANRTKEYLGIDNVHFYESDIKLFESRHKYDFVMSFAMHAWVGIEIEEYLNLLINFKNRDGLIIIESHIGNKDRENLKNAIFKSDLIIIEEGTTDDHLGNIRDFYLLK